MQCNENTTELWIISARSNSKSNVKGIDLFHLLRMKQSEFAYSLCIAPMKNYMNILQMCL